MEINKYSTVDGPRTPENVKMAKVFIARANINDQTPTDRETTEFIIPTSLRVHYWFIILLTSTNYSVGDRLSGVTRL